MNVADILGSARNNVVSGTDIFPQIDVAGVAKRLHLSEAGTEEGARNLPASESIGLDAHEQQVINEIENEGQSRLTEYLERQKTYNARGHSAGLSSLVFQLKSVAPDAEGELDKATRVGTGELFVLKRDVKDAEGDLQRFRTEHRLRRPVRNRAPLGYHAGFLLLILALEALLNGYFLAKGNTLGYLGGVTDAILIAALNIALGVGAGRLVLPWLWHRSVALKLLAALGVAAYLVLGVGFNVAVMHYRNAVAADPFEATAVAYRTLVTAPLDIQDLQSWQLFILGCAFSLAAAIDGLRMDDPYPGYGRRFREFDELSSEYVGLKEELLDDLQGIKKRAEAKMDDIVRSISTRQSELEHIASVSRSLRVSMLEHFRQLEGAGNTLLQIYRSENVRSRNSSPPARFETRWIYVPPVFEGEVFQIPDKDATDKAIEVALREAPAQRDRLHARYGAAVSEYERLDVVVAGAENG